MIAHPAVAEVAVWKTTGRRMGRAGRGLDVPTDDSPTLEELREIVAEAIAPWAAPKELVIVDDLPHGGGRRPTRRELDTLAP